MVQVYLFPIHTFYGIPQFRGIEGPLLIRYTTVLTRSAKIIWAILRVSACSRHTPECSCLCAWPLHFDENFLKHSHSFDFPISTKLLESTIAIFAPLSDFKHLSSDFSHFQLGPTFFEDIKCF